MTDSRLARRIPELDGVRGLAILLILTLHYFVEITTTRYVLFFRLAWSGVDLFFVLSGFLIAGILLDARSSRSYYKAFYLRRFYRIIPLYSIWLAIFLIGVYSVTPSSAVALRIIFNKTLPLWTYFVFLQNFAIAIAKNFGSAWMGITWSLAVEEQFYLLLPLIVRRLSRKALFRFTVVMILVAVALRIFFQISGADKLVLYTLLPCRMDSLGCGVLIALAYRNPVVWKWITCHRKYIYMAFLLLAFGVAMWTLSDFPLMTRIGYTWMAAFYSCLLLLVLASPGPMERMLFGNRVLVKLGTIAYAVYLFHSGILWIYHYLVFGKEPLVHDMASLLVTLLALVTTLFLAQLSWHFLEKPLIQRGHLLYSFTAEPKPVS